MRVHAPFITFGVHSNSNHLFLAAFSIQLDIFMRMGANSVLQLFLCLKIAGIGNLITFIASMVTYTSKISLRKSGFFLQLKCYHHNSID